MPQDQKNTTLEVVFDTPEQDTYRFTASQISMDDRYLPGFLQIRDEDGRNVGYLRAERVLMVRRTDSDPTSKPRTGAAMGPQVTITTTQPGGPPLSPAQLAALAQHAAKAARV